MQWAHLLVWPSKVQKLPEPHVHGGDGGALKRGVTEISGSGERPATSAQLPGENGIGGGGDGDGGGGEGRGGGGVGGGGEGGGGDGGGLGHSGRMRGE